MDSNNVLYLLHSDIERLETAPVETSAEETRGEGSGMRKDSTPVLAAGKRTSGSESLGGR